MKRSEYLRRALNAYNNGWISKGAYDDACACVGMYCDDDDSSTNEPSDSNFKVEHNGFDTSKK